MKTKVNILFLGLAFFLFSCGKDGETGPAGAQGPSGADGTANISIDEFTVAPGSWSLVSPSLYNTVITDNSITNNDSDLVMIYAKITTAGGWWAIPTQNWAINGDAMYYKYVGSTITIYYSYTSSPSVNVIFKVVVIPPAMKKRNIDYIDYNVVKTEYNLHD